MCFREARNTARNGGLLVQQSKHEAWLFGARGLAFMIHLLVEDFFNSESERRAPTNITEGVAWRIRWSNTSGESLWDFWFCPFFFFFGSCRGGWKYKRQAWFNFECLWIYYSPPIQVLQRQQASLALNFRIVSHSPFNNSLIHGGTGKTNVVPAGVRWELKYSCCLATSQPS